MGSLITPSDLEARSTFYQRMAVLSSAGVGLTDALRNLESNPPGKGYQKPIRSAISAIDGGATLVESLAQLDQRLGQFDLDLLRAAEASGRIDQVFRLLSDYYQTLGRMSKRMLSNLAYPTFLIHAVVLLAPLGTFTDLILKGAIEPYVTQKTLILVPFYSLVYLMTLLCQQRRFPLLNTFVEHALSRIPLLGSALRNLSLARLAMTLEAMISAGVVISQAWQRAGEANSSVQIQKTISKWIHPIEEGTPPSQLMGESRLFPATFTSQYSSGELGGSLDTVLSKLHQDHLEEGNRKLDMFTENLPRLVFVVVAIVVGMFVIKSFSSYFDTLNKVIGP